MRAALPDDLEVRPPQTQVNHSPVTRSRYAGTGWPQSHRAGAAAGRAVA